MRCKIPKKSKILDAIYQTAKDFHTAGIMPVTTMRRFEKHCLPAVHPLIAEDIKQIRAKENVSQSVFSVYLNTSLSTVQKWAIGEKKPSGAALHIPTMLITHSCTHPYP